MYEVDAHGATVVAAVAEARVDLAAPVRLKPIAIPKPWGRELWFSGMEARGEAEVTVGAATLPLSLYLSLAPAWLHQDQPIVLLKILDPLAQPVLGDLYFEVHERKEEVYVVTALDQQAWPDGVGAIRFGMNQELRRSFPSDAKFRAAFLAAVQSYEAVRRVLDGEPGAVPGSDEPLQAAVSGAEPEAALQSLEQQRRAAMERFTTLLPLRIGDIVTVPPWHPHSLQHGVQVVEFQSPTYERFIISFAQKVLTQEHWDSAEAIARMSLTPLDPTPSPDPQLPAGVARIASYQDFGALRVTFAEVDGHYDVPAKLPYAIAICIQGGAQCGELMLQPGDACFLPGRGLEGQLRLIARAEQSIILIAAPGL